MTRQDQQAELYLSSSGSTRQGKTRSENQDALYHWCGQTALGEALGLYILCDGLGGYTAGGRASRMAIDIVTSELMPALETAEQLPLGGPAGPAPEALAEWVDAAVVKANDYIYREAWSHHSGDRMGTTLTLAVLIGPTGVVANVGDSRTYHWRDRQLAQVTRDHSLVAKLVELGRLRDAEAATHPNGNIILRALGTEEQVAVDVFPLQVMAGDKLLLCSDGFWKAFPRSNELASLLSRSAAPAALCRELSAESFRRSGTDDNSLIIVTAT